MDSPPGYTFDPNQSTSSQVIMVIITSIFLPLSTMALAIRLFTRVVMERRFALDDGFMTAAWVFNVLHISFTMKMLSVGLGKSMWNVTVDEFSPDFLLFDILGTAFFWLSSGVAKCSILLFYLHIFPIKALHIAVWVTFSFILCYSVGGFLADIFSCRPVSASWNLSQDETAVCIDQNAFYIAQAALGIVADVATFIIPLPLLSTLRLPLQQKIAVGFMLTVGAR